MSSDRGWPRTNAEGFDLWSRAMSPRKAAGFEALGLTLVQGERDGVYVSDLDGNRYVNCRSSGGVFNFGHRPRFAIDALHRALDEVGDMGDWLIPSARRARGAEALARVLPGDLRYTFFTPSGAEAIEVACKLARGVTGRKGFVAAEHGYHGHVGFSMAMDEDQYSQWFGPLVPGIVKIPFGDADAVDRAVGDDTAAVCMETIPATAGYTVTPDDFWPRVRATCDERGALLILDEVQAGMGRTGRVWACERWGVVPDLLVTGKALSGGVYPIAACCFGDRVDAFFSQDPIFHPSSYAGSELGAAVVEAVIAEVSRPGFLEHVGEMGDRFAAGFDRLCARYPSVLAGHRGVGLMRVLDTHSEALGTELMLGAIRNGVLAIIANNRKQSLLVMPPLVISGGEVDEVLTGLDRALASIAAETVPAAGG